MAEIMTIGLTHIKMGDVAGDGGMGTSLTVIGDGRTLEGTARLTKAEDERTDFFAEEIDDPIYQSTKKGITTLEWTIVDFTAAELARVMGGTDNSGTWEAPDSAADIEQSIEVLTKTNLKIELVRCKISGSFDTALGRAELGQVKVIATVLHPSKAVPAYQISQYTPPSS
jgi:hypothetical protein